MTALNPYLKIGRQLTEVLQVHKKMPYKEAKKRAMQALSEVKIQLPKNSFNQYPHELSGGMRQRVIIAMAMLCEPKLIIADEPTTALDVTVQTEIVSLLRKVLEQHQTSIVLITHDIPLVAGLCDKIIIMYAGQIVEMAMVTEIYEHALHPYTRALLKATPSNIDQDDELATIPGQPPDLSKPIKGCAFAPRCDFVDEYCKEVQPQIAQVTATQSVACFHRNGK
jgi:oligopeptide transport system ATP-binding protein